MKLIFSIFAAALLCGCQPKWEYKTVTIDNLAADAAFLLLNDKAKSATEAMKGYDSANASPGTFNLETPTVLGITNTPDSLNHLGREGWELVSAVPQIETLKSNIRTGKIILIFKRPK